MSEHCLGAAQSAFITVFQRPVYVAPCYWMLGWRRPNTNRPIEGNCVASNVKKGTTPTEIMRT